MKAIANAIETKALEPGFLARAVRPVAGFGFEHLFTLTQTLVAKDAIAPEAQPSGEIPVDPNAVPLIGPAQIDAGQMPVGFSLLDARVPDAILGQTDASDGVGMPLATDPETALQMDQSMRAPWLSATEPHRAYDITTAAFALPQAFDLVSENVPLSTASEALDGLTNLSDPNGLGLAPLVERTQGLAAPVGVAAPGADDNAVAAPRGPWSRGGETPLGAPVEAPKALPRLEDGALKPLDQRVIPDEEPLRLATTDAVEGEDTLAEAPLKARPRSGQGDGAKSLNIELPLKRQSTAIASAPGKVETPPVAVAPTPSPLPLPLPATAAASPNPVVAAMTVQPAQAEKRDGQLLPKGTADVEARILRRTGALRPDTAPGATGRADVPRPEALQATTERVDPILATTAVARSPVSVASAPPQATAALPPAVALNLRQADWGKQLVSQIERMVTDGVQRIELSLRPKNLGEVQVLLDLRGDQASVHLVCETAAAARLLMGAEDKLAQVLDQSGYRLSGFSAQDHGTGAQTGQPGQQSPRRSRAAVDTNTREDPSDAAATSPYSADRGRPNGINVLA